MLTYIQGKQFIIRGAELEKLGHLVTRLKKRFPKAEVIPQTDNIDVSNGLCIFNFIFNYFSFPNLFKGRNWNNKDIFVRSCKPTVLPPSLTQKAKTKIIPKFIPKYPPKLRQYTLANDVNVFYFSRPFRKSAKKADNEHNVCFIFYYYHHYYFIYSISPI